MHPLLRSERASLARFSLAPGRVTRAISHRHVEEFWYVLAGVGELWTRTCGSESVLALRAGVTAHLPAGVAFQFRCAPDSIETLQILGTTVPAWPGDEEALVAVGRWPSDTVR